MHLFLGDLRHAGSVFVEQAGGFCGGPCEEHLRQNGREQRRPAHTGRVPQGLSAGRGTVQDARPLMRLIGLPRPPLKRLCVYWMTKLNKKFNLSHTGTSLIHLFLHYRTIQGLIPEPQVAYQHR